MIVYSRASEPRAAHVLEALEVGLAAGDADDARAQHRNQLRRPAPCAGSAEERAARRRPGRAGCRAGTCPARPRRPAPRTRSSRLACSDRTPTMKKRRGRRRAGSTRVWLPGRDRCSTAWRSGNDGEFASGATARSAARPASCSTTASAAKPAADDEADAQRRRLPRGERRPAPATTSTITAMPQPVAAGAVASRRAAAATA